ncbi:MAG: hypothetical protein ACD_75C02623G0007 [uncultured bacterium]|nr:MAG: hypothetical protein ACD_75C02623G0007 [uncultured bacterium]
MQLPELPPTLTIPEGAIRWGCSEGKLRIAISKGELKAIMPGKKILINLDEGDSWWRSSGEKLIKVGSRRKRK